MTIKSREWLFWIIFALSSVLFGLAVSFLSWLGNVKIEEIRLAIFFNNNSVQFYTVIVVAMFFGFFASVLSGLIAMRSGKTVSLEIFFFNIWAFFQIFELIKILSLLFAFKGLGQSFFDIETRIVLFGRYSGILAIFVGSLFATGLKQERALVSLGIITITGLLFAFIQPLNSVGPSSDLLVERGMYNLILAFNFTLIVLTSMNYIVAWKSNKDKSYLYACCGLLMCIISSIFIKNTVSFWMAGIYATLIMIGSWMYLYKMHQYYLWR